MAARGKYSGGATGRIVRWLVVLAVIGGVAVGGYVMSSRAGDAVVTAQEDLHQDLQAAFGRTSYAQIDLLNQATIEGDDDDRENLDHFLAKAGPSPSSFRATDDGYIARYQAKAWGRTRTVRVVWTTEDVKVIDD